MQQSVAVAMGDSLTDNRRSVAAYKARCGGFEVLSFLPHRGTNRKCFFVFVSRFAVSTIDWRLQELSRLVIWVCGRALLDICLCESTQSLRMRVQCQMLKQQSIVSGVLKVGRVAAG